MAPAARSSPCLHTRAGDENETQEFAQDTSAAAKVSVDELSGGVYDELRYMMDMMSIGTDAEFAGAAATILTDIFSRELSGNISEVRRHKLINAFIVACVANEEAHRVTLNMSA